ncbi:MAG: TPM domain-containing protein [Casimicrobium sp.]
MNANLPLPRMRATAYAPLLALACALLLACVARVAYAQDLAPIPPLQSRVTDTSGAIGVSAKQELEQKLAAFEQSTGGQLAVLVVKTAEPETIEQYALRVAESWKIGKKGKDNGALIVLAMQERKIRIEVGYGWEGALPDVEAKRIIRETMAPFFKQNQFAQGIDAAIDKIQLAVSKENKAASNTVNDKGQWEQSHNATAKDATVESLLGMAPVLLGVLAIFSFILPSLIVGGIAGVGTFFFTGSMPAAGIAGFIAFVLASILKGIFGSFRRGAPLGGRRVHRNSGWSSGPWISTGGGSSGGWSSGGDSGGFSGGGGDFGGGGASGDW